MKQHSSQQFPFNQLHQQPSPVLMLWTETPSPAPSLPPGMAQSVCPAHPPTPPWLLTSSQSVRAHHPAQQWPGSWHPSHHASSGSQWPGSTRNKYQSELLHEPRREASVPCIHESSVDMIFVTTGKHGGTRRVLAWAHPHLACQQVPILSYACRSQPQEQPFIPFHTQRVCV
jgi:hypothetical protein